MRLLVSVSLWSVLFLSRAFAADAFTGEAAVIAKIRAASNAAIAAHDVTAIGSFLDKDIRITAGSGRAVEGREQAQALFAEQFQAAPGLVYTRMPVRITLSGVYPLAAENGAWVGRWTEAGKVIEFRGEYLAMWRKGEAGWLIRSELFITLERRENGLVVPQK